MLAANEFEIKELENASLAGLNFTFRNNWNIKYATIHYEPTYFLLRQTKSTFFKN